MRWDEAQDCRESRVNGKQAKRARGIANTEAQRRGLWKQGEKGVYAKWWRRLLARFFPKLRKRYADAVGRWYKRTLKDFARQAYAYIHDRDAQRFQAMRDNMKRKAWHERNRKKGKTIIGSEP